MELGNWIVKWFVPRLVVALISGSIISWALAAYLISQFQSLVDTVSAQLTSRIESSDNRILALDEWSRSFSNEIKTELQSVVKIEQSFASMTDAQEVFFRDNQMRIAALAESTDFLIGNAAQMLRDYVTPEPQNLGLVALGSNADLRANENGILALQFETASEVYPFLTFEFRALPADSVKVSMYSQRSKGDPYFIEVFSAVTQPIAFGSAKIGLVPTYPGLNYILIEGSPNIDVKLEFFEIPKEQ
jgi:hypothetical protein